MIIVMIIIIYIYTQYRFIIYIHIIYIYNYSTHISIHIYTYIYIYENKNIRTVRMGVLPGEVDFDCAWPVLFACWYVDDMATWLTRQTCFQNTKLWTLNHDKEELFTPNACAGRASTGWAAENNQATGIQKATKGHLRNQAAKKIQRPHEARNPKRKQKATKRQPTNLGPKRNHFGNFRAILGSIWAILAQGTLGFIWAILALLGCTWAMQGPSKALFELRSKRKNLFA